MPILSVFTSLLKGCFFGFYVNGVTLADEEKPPLCKGRWVSAANSEGLSIPQSAPQTALPGPRPLCPLCGHFPRYRGNLPFTQGGLLPRHDINNTAAGHPARGCFSSVRHIGICITVLLTLQMFTLFSCVTAEEQTHKRKLTHPTKHIS